VGTFRPGDLLSDHLAVFVWEPAGGERAATDHSEQLARSKCKLASGDRMWCGTCHDPHSQPAAADRVAFYRRSCTGCHTQKSCALGIVARAAAGDDCASCHMPKNRSREGEHVVYTDHTIARRPASPTEARRDRKLRTFWGGPPEQRDLAIAYASFGDAALPLLEKLQLSDDAAVLVQLGQFYDALGKEELAESLYERGLRLDPSSAAAGANLAIYRARKGRSKEAIALWQDVFSRNPALATAGFNLAVAQLGAGDRAGARLTLRRLLQFHPDLDAARQLLTRVR
jgi:tetratricopeptide (TPR) repeat protein